MRLFVKVSLLPQTLTLKNEIKDKLAGEGVDLNEVLARVGDAEQRWNCKLINHQGDVIMCSV